MADDNDQVIPATQMLLQASGVMGKDVEPATPDNNLTPASAKLLAATGRPQWTDESYSRESRLADIARTHAQGGSSFEDARPDIEALGVDPEKHRALFRLEEERSKAQQMGSNPVTGRLDPSTARNVGQVLPFAGSVMNWNDARQYGRAIDRLKNGQATDEDYSRIAQYEEMAKRQGQRTLGQTLGQTAATLPGMAVEQLAGGAAAGKLLGAAGRGVGNLAARYAGGGGEAAAQLVNNPATQLAASTALTPAMYAQQGAQNLNEAKDRDSFLQQAKSYGAAFTAGTIQNAILGRLQSGTSSFSKNLAGRTAGGILEQSTADMITGAAGMTSGYGSLVDLAKGKYGDAGKELAVQTMTFGVFAALHKSQKAGDDAMRQVVDRLDELKKADVPLDVAAKLVQRESIAEPFDTSLWTEANRPGEPRGAHFEPPSPTTPPEPQKPGDRPGVIPDVLRAAGLSDKLEYHDNKALLTNDAVGEQGSLGYPEHFTGLTYDPSRNALRLDFDRTDGGDITGKIGASHKVPVELFRDLKKIAKAASEKGLDIEYDAEDRRHQSYSDLLKKAGMELVQTDGDGVAKHYLWRPKGAETAPPRPEVPPGRPVPMPEPPRPAEAKPEPINPKFDELRRNFLSGQDVDPKEVFSAAGLTDREQHVVSERLAGRTHGEIGEDLGVTRQRVKQIEDKARGKLGMGESVEDVNARSRMDRAIDMFANGARVDVNDLRHDPAEVRRIAKERLTLEDEVDKKLDRLLDRMEKDDAAGKLTPELEAQYRAEIDKLGQSLEASSRQAQGAAGEAQPVPGRRKPAPIRREAGTGVQGGTEPTAAPPAGPRTRPTQAAPGAGVAETGRPNAQAGGAGPPAAAGGGEADRGGVGQSGPPSNNPPGAPVPGVTRGTNASSPLTQAQVDAAVLSGATGEGGRGGLGAMAKGATPSTTPVPPATPAKVPSGIAAAWHWLQDREGILGGQIAPQTSRLNEEAGNKLARLAATADNLTRTVDYFSKQEQALLLDQAKAQVEAEMKAGGSGLKPSREQIQHTADFNGDLYQSANNEIRLRMERAANMATERMELERAARSSDPEVRMDARRKAAAAKDAYEAIGTMIGAKFYDERAFQAVVNSPGYKEFMKWYGQKDGVSDKLEELYRKSQGMDPDADIASRNQIKGGVFQMKAVREGETLDDADRVYGGPGRKGNLLNPRVKILGSSKAFTGSADAYDTNPYRVMEFSFAQRMRNAAEAETVRTLLASKTPDGKPLAYPKLPGSDLLPGYKIFTTKRLPPEIKSGYPAGTEINLAVHPDVYPELVRAYDLSALDHILAATESNKFGRTLKAAVQLPTAINLVGVAEGTSHCIAQASIVLARGGIRSLPDMVSNIFKSMMRSPDAMRDLMEMSARGETKGQHMEWALNEQGMLWGGKYDPTSYLARAQQATIGRFMDRWDDAMRLSMAHAFDRIADAHPGVIKSEQNKRDFINQLGNYQRQTQHWAVALVRDLGLGPFATAATNNIVQSIRTLALGRGLKTADYATQLKLRAELGLQLVGVLGAGALVNYLLHNRVDGDDNTPLGGLKLPGNNGYIDLAALANIRRGSKTIGLQALIEGERYGGKGATSGTILSNAEESAGEAVIHPAAGPGVNLGRSVLFGKDVIGRPTVARNKEHDFWAKLQGALLTENPMLEMIAKLSGVKTHPGKQEETTQTIERGLGLGSILKKSNRPPGKPLPTQ
jgi:predicted transcriptional regulator